MVWEKVQVGTGTGQAPLQADCRAPSCVSNTALRSRAIRRSMSSRFPHNVSHAAFTYASDSSSDLLFWSTIPFAPKRKRTVYI